MKKFKKLSFIFLLVFTFYITPFSSTVKANPPTITKEYFPDGSYIETQIIQTSNTKSTITGARKRSTYKNSSGSALWYGEVTANFYFDGSTSRCTSATASAGSYHSLWRIKSKSASKSGNTATASIVASSYTSTGTLIGNKNLTVTLSCDRNGNLY